MNQPVSLSEPNALATPPEGQQGNSFREIRFEGVRHAFSSGRRASRYAIAELNLAVEANEFVTVVGPSGCGKSTLFNLASGLIEPTEGTITVNGDRLDGVNPYVGFMFQHAALMDWRTVLDNAIVGQEFLGVPRDQARREAREGFKHFGLAGFEDHRPWELSGGMRQRVALLRTYLTQRELLLLDEPFGALDALTRLKMQQFLLDRWQEDQRTILFITHDVDEALLLGDRVIVLGPRPTYVMTELRVGFPRPRNAENIILDPEFVAMKHRLLSLLVPNDEEATP
jgi:NitT/TauT family transport system ATP-binding protein